MMVTNVRKAQSGKSELRKRIEKLKTAVPADTVTEKRFTSYRETVTENFEKLFTAVNSQASLIESLDLNHRSRMRSHWGWCREKINDSLAGLQGKMPDC